MTFSLHKSATFLNQLSLSFSHFSFQNTFYMFQEPHLKMLMMKNLFTLWHWRSASCSLDDLADMFRIRQQAQINSIVAVLKSSRQEMNKDHVIFPKNPDTEQLNLLQQMERAPYDTICYTQLMFCWECVNHTL